MSLSRSGRSVFVLLPDPVLGVPLALVEKTPLRVQSALLQDFLLQPVFVGSQGRRLSLLPVSLPLRLLLHPSQSTPSLVKLILQTRALRSTRGCRFGGHLLRLVLLLHR